MEKSIEKMTENQIIKQYKIWREKAVEDEDVVRELEEMAADGVSLENASFTDEALEIKAITDKTLANAALEDAFFKNLSFGTGGLRGVIGAGTNRMNIYTVAKASQGQADYVKKISHQRSGGLR